MKLLIAILIAFSFAGLAGCNDDYFTDGGKIDENIGLFKGTTMEYLDSQPAKFDTLTALIRLCALEGEVNKNGSTFFAPQNYSIHNFFKLIFPDGAWPPLSQVTAEQKTVIGGILKNYLIPDKKIVRPELSTAYSYAQTLGDRKARFNLVKDDYLGNVNMGASHIVFSLDVKKPTETKEVFQSVSVVTSGIQTTNGVVHVLAADTHIFGFN